MTKKFLTALLIVLCLLVSCESDEGVFEQVTSSKVKTTIDIYQLVDVIFDEDGNFDYIYFLGENGLYWADRESTVKVFSPDIRIEQAYHNKKDDSFIFRYSDNSAYTYKNGKETKISGSYKGLSSDGILFNTDSTTNIVLESENDVLTWTYNSTWKIAENIKDKKVIKAVKVTNSPSYIPVAFQKVADGSWYAISGQGYFYHIVKSGSTYKAISTGKESSITTHCASFARDNVAYFKGSSYYHWVTKEDSAYKTSSVSINKVSLPSVPPSLCILPIDNAWYIATQNEGFYKVTYDNTFKVEQIKLGDLAK